MKIILESVNVSGEIIADSKKIEKILSDPFTFHYIPQSTLTNKEKGDISVRENLKVEGLVMINFPEARLSSKVDPRSFVILCEYLLERARQEKFGICSISSSSVYKEDKGILFFGGATNLGKTTCAIELSKNGFELYSDEKTLLDLERKIMCGGSKNIPLRKGIIKKKFKQDKEYKKIEENHKRPSLKFIILPHIDHGLKEPITYQFESRDLFWGLTNEFSRKIRGTTKFINCFQYLLPSIDTDDLAQRRIELTKKLAREIPGYYFQGNLEQLVEFVLEKWKEK